MLMTIHQIHADIQCYIHHKSPSFPELLNKNFGKKILMRVMYWIKQILKTQMVLFLVLSVFQCTCKLLGKIISIFLYRDIAFPQPLLSCNMYFLAKEFDFIASMMQWQVINDQWASTLSSFCRSCAGKLFACFYSKLRIRLQCTN